MRIVLLLLALPGTTMPERAIAQSELWDVVFENDALIGMLPGEPNSDHEYTHGLSVGFEGKKPGLWNRVFSGLPPCDTSEPSARCIRTRLEGGQKIYTPDFVGRLPATPQRPFAGWLYAATAARVLTPEVARSLRIEAGITGEPSLAAFFQRTIHQLTGYPVPSGWDDQLAFEPGVLVRYAERYRLATVEADGISVMDLSPSWHVTAGNVRTDLQVGLTLRAGYRLPHQWYPSQPAQELSAFAIVNAREQWTLRDLFLDGNTFEESPRVERRPLTGAVEAGWGIQYDAFTLTYTVVWEDRLYETQPEPHMYTRITLAVQR